MSKNLKDQLEEFSGVAQSLDEARKKLSDAEADYDIILKNIASKQPILDKLVYDIREAEAKLNDDFSRERLEFKKAHETEKNKLNASLESLKSSMSDLDAKCEVLENDKVNATRALKAVFEDLAEAEDKLKMTEETNSQTWAEIKEFEEARDLLDTQVVGLKAKRDSLKNEVKSQEIQWAARVDATETDFEEQKSKLDLLIEESKEELRKLEKSILLHKNKNIQIDEEYEKKELALTRWEDKLNIKTEALARERKEFETETRRWNYSKA